MKGAEKRKVRGYKITDKAYNKALRKAPAYNTFLASLIEGMVIAFGDGDITTTEVDYYLSQSRGIKKKAK